MSKVIAIKWNNQSQCVTTHEPYIDGRAACEAAAYAIGWREPNYPVPAIRQGFEWVHRVGRYKPGRDLFEGACIELIHWHQERF